MCWELLFLYAYIVCFGGVCCVFVTKIRIQATIKTHVKQTEPQLNIYLIIVVYYFFYIV